MQRHTWRLVAPGAAVLRHCQGCGRATEFRNSGKVRRNANGKRIYQFEIYKCDRDHTWNRPVPVTEPGEEPCAAPLEEGSGLIRLEIRDLPVEILIERCDGSWRLDKVLADRLDGLSRAAVAALIDSGGIRVNGQAVRARHLLRTGDLIAIREVQQGACG
jgi:hypothetical protein